MWRATHEVVLHAGVIDFHNDVLRQRRNDGFLGGERYNRRGEPGGCGLNCYKRSGGVASTASALTISSSATVRV